VLEASLGALAQLIIGAVALLVCLGALLVAQAAPRERFVQIGVLQALGMAQPEVGRWLVLEHSLSLVASLLMGSWLGRQVALWVLPLLDTGVSNRFILDVTEVATSWLWVGGFVLAVTLSLLAPLLLTTRALGPLALRSGLRLGDEV
jgi:ABC-type lipoprotein release transport system permease subunit